MASTEVEQPSKPLKTWVFKVSIHCEGCKRKVQKILQSLPGVNDIDIQTRQQRVVITGDVSPEAIIRKLVKAGKHAELWPEKPDKNSGNINSPEINSRKTEKPPSKQEKIIEESAVTGKEIKPSPAKTEIPVPDSSKISNTTASGGGGKIDEGVGKSEVAGRGGKVTVEVKVEEKKPETGSAGNQASQPVVEKKEEQTEKTGGGGGGGGGGGEGGGDGTKKKKKKKKGQNSNKNGSGQTSSSAAPPVIGGSPGGGGPLPTTLPSNQNPPRHYGYQYLPPHYYTPPPAPVYTVSHNTAHPPVNSYTASYYAAPPPHSYADSRSSSEMDPPPPPHSPLDFDSYTHQPLDSFEMFSDENPNGCLVM